MSKKIFVCDDDESIVDVIKIVLEDKGYHVDIITHSEDLENKIKKSRPDIILLDLWMPNIDGQTITRRLKSHPETASIPIIVISANNDTQKIAIQAGADSYLAKPFDIGDLEKEVAKYISH